jgi:transposase
MGNVKNEESQASAAVFRALHLFVRQRTQAINALRGFSMCCDDRLKRQSIPAASRNQPIAEQSAILMCHLCGMEQMGINGKRGKTAKIGRSRLETGTDPDYPINHRFFNYLEW